MDHPMMLEGVDSTLAPDTDGMPVDAVMIGGWLAPLKWWRTEKRAEVKKPGKEPKSKPPRARITYANFDRERDYAAFFAIQRGACAICRRAVGYRMLVDHCHATGVVRGLLCRHCNAGLGFFRDKPAVMLAAAGYVALFQE